MCPGKDIFTCLIAELSPAIQANSYYFGHPKWAKRYLKAYHRYDARSTLASGDGLVG